MVDKAGISVSANFRIVLSGVSGSVNNIEEFMEEVDAHILRLPPSHDTIVNAISILGPVLQVTKQVIDKVTKVKCCTIC